MCEIIQININKHLFLCIMGCVSSKGDVSDSNVYEVMNVNETGQSISPGRLKVNEAELILYQEGKTPLVWPLRCLRKYGYDSDLFTFECGRRCPTGEGIYAFKCRKAEQLFNTLQHNIQLRNLSEDTTNQPNEIQTVTTNSTGVPVHNRRVPSQPEGYVTPTQALNAVTTNTATRTVHVLSRPGSINSNGPTSPTLSPPPHNGNARETEFNNNKRGSLASEHPYTNTSGLVAEVEMENMPNYINLNVTSPMVVLHSNYVNVSDANSQQNSPVYMNVNTTDGGCAQVAKDLPNLANPNIFNDRPNLDADIDDRHCYANIDAVELETFRPIPDANNVDSTNAYNTSVPQTPTTLAITVREVNYAELDLISSSNRGNQPLAALPESPTDKKRYVTIDFNKTNALSQSINPRKELEDGSRKTRHNSTIGELPTRHSNSLSD